MSDVNEWWVAMYAHPPSNPREIREYQACVRAWEKHPDPKIQCECGHIYRCWVGDHMACGNPRCPHWGKTHDGQNLVDPDTAPGEALAKIHEEIKRNESH